MGRGLLRLVCLAWALALGAAPAHAAPAVPVIEASCHAATAADVSLAEMAASPERWSCRPDQWDNTRAAAWLSFDAERWRDGPAPVGFVSHITRFDRITVAAVGADGTVRSHAYSEAQVELLENGPLFTVALPPVTADTARVIVRIDRPHNLTVLTEARVTPRPHLSGWPPAAVAMIAVIAGMLVIPLVFDVSFYTVLHERFLVLHAAMVASMIGYLLFSGGLVLAFVRPSIDLVAIAGPLFFAAGAAASAFFLLEFLEREALPRAMRGLLKGAAVWSVLVPGTMALQLDAFQPFDNAGFFYGFLPVLAVFAATLAVALLRGSRAVRLVALAWIPILLCCAERILRGMGFYSAPDSLDRLMFVAFALEVVTVWLAVNQRFLRMKQDRDKARLEARLLAELSERDPLTGLMNRRAIESRFGACLAKGYRTLAVLDLDRFKQINDSHGHATGDEVLRACARAFTGIPDLLAIRMGGEEFLFLLRGPAAQEVAERLGAGLTGHIAREVPALDRAVTASMGVVHLGDAALPSARFDDVYARADTLLYEAKAAGRDRTFSEAVELANGSGVIRAAA